MGKVGAVAGGQNALNHLFYPKSLIETKKMAIEEVKGIKGLDDKLALPWVILCRVLGDNLDRIDILLEAVGMIARLPQTWCSITPQDEELLKYVITCVIRDVAISPGLNSIN